MFFGYALTYYLFSTLTAIEPRFDMKDSNSQYAVEGRRAKIVCHVYTHVNSEIKWFFNGEKLMMDERYNSNLYPSGE